MVSEARRRRLAGYSPMLGPGDLADVFGWDTDGRSAPTAARAPEPTGGRLGGPLASTPGSGQEPPPPPPPEPGYAIDAAPAGPAVQDGHNPAPELTGAQLHRLWQLVRGLAGSLDLLLVWLLLAALTAAVLLSGCDHDRPPRPDCYAGTTAQWRPDPAPGYWACVIP